MDHFEYQVYVIPLDAWAMESGVGKLNIVGVFFFFPSSFWVCGHGMLAQQEGRDQMGGESTRTNEHARKREDSPM